MSADAAAPGHNQPSGDDEARRAHVLAWLHCIFARITMFRTEVDMIGVSLKRGFITPDDALAWLGELDPNVLALVGADTSPDDNWGTGWGEAAAEYHADRRGHIA